MTLAHPSAQQQMEQGANRSEFLDLSVIDAYSPDHFYYSVRDYVSQDCSDTTVQLLSLSFHTSTNTIFIGIYYLLDFYAIRTIREFVLGFR